MTSPVWLIAEREFRTYVATLSFWVALAVGPLAAGGGLMLAQNIQHPVQPTAIKIVSQNSTLTHDTEAALREAARLEGRRLAFGDSGHSLTVNAVSPATWCAMPCACGRTGSSWAKSAPERRSTCCNP